MPEFIKEFLEGLTDEQAEAAWLWLDGGDMFEAVDAILESHPAVAEANTCDDIKDVASSNIFS
jgi:hypothetical protein